MKKIWIFAEQTENSIHLSYFELLSKVRELYPTDSITAVVFGKSNKQAVETLASSGANTVISAEHEKLAAYHPEYWALTLARLAENEKPDILLVSATAIGSELAPTVAAKLDTGLAAHCADLCVDENGGLITLIPAFGGKLLGEIMVPEKKPAMASVRPGVFDSQSLSPADSVNCICADVSFLNDIVSKISVTATEAVQTTGSNIEDADVVVCAGLGISSQVNWDKAQKLAKLLNGALGYTRPAVDMGYVANESAMIGTSGKTVRPKLYIGFGVSGSAHHVCGMKDAKTIININTDEKAECFRVSDYKLVGDSGTVLDELLHSLE